MLSSTCAIFPTRDMERTIAFYTALGFAVQGRYPSYVILEKDAVEVHFAHNPVPAAEPSDFAAYFRTDDVDGWSDEIAALDIFEEDGFPRFGRAADRAWGMREMHILDTEGHLLRVGQHIHG